MADQETVRPGQRLGHYVVGDQLGAGGMGLVFRARDEALGRAVAIKVLPNEVVEDPAARKRLLREARLAASLNHPHICTIYEVGEEGARAFIAMELLDGRPLKEVVRSSGLPPSTVLRYGIQLADALAYAHRHGVIHRDLKSANVVVTAEGPLKVLDFGLARQVATETSATTALSNVMLTEDGAIVGTPDHLSPELLSGAEADTRSDLWALGVVLYEMVSGKLPFAGHTRFEIGAAILNASPPPLPDTVPAGLRAVIARCLEKDPTQRYRQAEEVRASLEALQADSSRPPVDIPRRAIRPSVSRRGIGVASTVLVSLVIAVLLLGRYRGCPGMVSGSVIRSLAVLPLQNLSGDPSQEYFADGMTDELINTLAQVGALRVISRTSVMEYKEKHVPVRDIARDLKVQAVLEGSVRTFQNRVKVTVELIQAAGERVLWGDSYERGLTDVLSLQGEVARAIVGKIRLELTPRERMSLARERPVNPDAYQQYLLGRQALYSENFTLPQLNEAFAHFRRAIQIDSTCAIAYSGLGEAYYAISNYYVPPDSAMPQAMRAAKHALQLDEGLAEAHTLLGIVAAAYEWNWSRAEVEFKRAVELNPGGESPHFYYGYFLDLAGHFREATEQLQIARELDPLSGYVRWVCSWPAFYRRDYDGAITELTKQVGIDSTLWMPYSLLGEAYEMKGQLAEAALALRQSRAKGGNAWARAALARVYAKMGQRDSTARLLKDLKDMSSQVYVAPYAPATVYMALGDHDKAFQLLDQAFRERSEDLLILQMDPRVDPLRSDPRFGALLKRLKSPA